MDYTGDSNELDKLNRDMAALSAQHREQRPEFVTKRGETVHGRIITRWREKARAAVASPELAQFNQWQMGKLADDEHYHIIARLSLLSFQTKLVEGYKRLLTEAINMSAMAQPPRRRFWGWWPFKSKERTLEDVKDEMETERREAQRRIDEHIRELSQPPIEATV